MNHNERVTCTWVLAQIKNEMVQRAGNLSLCVAFFRIFVFLIKPTQFIWTLKSQLVTLCLISVYLLHRFAYTALYADQFVCKAFFHSPTKKSERKTIRMQNAERSELCLNAKNEIFLFVDTKNRFRNILSKPK